MTSTTASLLEWPSNARSFGIVLDRIFTGELTVESYAQPIVDLKHGVVAGYEALARFPRQLGMSPEQCLTAADMIGRRLDLEAELARVALLLRSDLPQNCFLSVNASPEFLLSSQWSSIFHEASDLSGVVVEITEQQAIDDYSAMRRQLDRLRCKGATIAIDDTGAGYASLKHVMELRPDFIKLDRLFVEGCHLEVAKREMIEMLGDTASRLNAWLVAEGIETHAELDELLRLGVPFGQGYFLGRPAPQMCPLDTERAETIRARSRVFSASYALAAHMEPCVAAASVEGAEHMLHTQTPLQAVVVIDSWGRPTEIVERHPLLGIRRIPSLMRVQAASQPDEVLTRSINRAASERFDTLAIINDQGTFEGIVRLDQLMKAVLDSSRMRASQA